MLRETLTIGEGDVSCGCPYCGTLQPEIQVEVDALGFVDAHVMTCANLNCNREFVLAGQFNFAGNVFKIEGLTKWREQDEVDSA